MFSSLLRCFRSRPRTVVNRAAGRKKTTCKLHLEALEDRIDLDDARARMKEKGSTSWAKVKKDLGL